MMDEMPSISASFSVQGQEGGLQLGCVWDWECGMLSLSVEGDEGGDTAVVMLSRADAVALAGMILAMVGRPPHLAHA
jgi:hypothetical protein